MAHAEALMDIVERVAGMDDAMYRDESIRRDLFDSINDVAKAMPSALSPPLALVIYAVRNIIEPSFLPQLIPNLLRLIVHLEIIRNARTETIRRILSQPDALSLTSEELVALRKCIELQAPFRKVYREVINACCLLHIHYLWRANTEIPIYDVFITYFPAFAERDPDPAVSSRCKDARKSCPWHHDVSEQDIADNLKAGKLAVQFMVGAAQYAEDPERYCMDHGLDVDVPFDEIFPPPGVDGIVCGVRRFIEFITNIADTLEFVLEERPDH